MVAKLLDDKYFKIAIYYILLPVFVILVLFTFFTDDVSATTIDMYDYSYSSTSFTTAGRYEASRQSDLSNYESLSIGGVFTGKMYYFNVYMNYNFQANTKYTLTLNANGSDWRNTINNRTLYDRAHSARISHTYTFVSKSKIKIVFTPTQATSNVYLELYNSSHNAITGDTNFGVLSIKLDFTGSDEAIINNQNQNTQDIIDSNNSNTEDIINNQEENTEQLVGVMQEGYQKIVDEGQCPTKNNFDWKNYFYSKGYIGSDGNVVSDNTYLHSPFLKLKANTTYKITFGPNRSGKYACTYLGNQQMQTCYQMNSGPIIFTTTNTQGLLLRVSMIVSNNIPVPTQIDGPICNNWLLESQQLQKDAITDDNVDSGTGANFFNDFSETDHGGISSIITKPLTIINNLLSNNGSCTDLSLPDFMGATNVVLPSGCILWNRASSSIVNLWYIFVVGLGSYFVLKDLFKLVENLKNPDNDKVEVMDL